MPSVELKQFTLTLIVKEPRAIHRIEADDLLNLLTQFHFILADVVKRTEQEKYFKKLNEIDEIPF